MDSQIDVLYKLKKLHNKMINKSNKVLKKNDITDTQMRTIYYLIEKKQCKPVYQKEIQEFFCLKHSTVIGILKRLECKKLIKIRYDDDDKRKKIITVTEKAIEKEANIINHKQNIIGKAYEGFEEKEIIEFNKLLDKFINNIDKDSN